MCQWAKSRQKVSKEFWHCTFSELSGPILAASPVTAVSKIGTRQLTDNFDSFGKPCAMVETNDTAERLEMPKAKVTLRGTPPTQVGLVTCSAHW